MKLNYDICPHAATSSVILVRKEGQLFGMIAYIENVNSVEDGYAIITPFIQDLPAFNDNSKFEGKLHGYPTQQSLMVECSKYGYTFHIEK